MRRPTTLLLVIAVAIVAVALVLRSGRDADPTTTTGGDAAPTTTTTMGDTTSAGPSTTSSGITLPPGGDVCGAYAAIEVTGSIASPDLVEASGMAVSRTSSGILWAHNDSRGGPVLYAFTPDGDDLGEYTIPDAFAIDWEDMGAGPGPDGTGSFLYVGDMGDNFGIRDGSITIWRVPDIAPSDLVGATFPDAQPIPYRMPDGPHDAEALFIDPVEPALYVITKSRSEAFVYRGPLSPSSDAHVMELVTTLFLDAEVSGADISPDGGLIALRGYDTVWMWAREPGMSIADAFAAEPCLAPSPEERQGEAIGLDVDWSYFTVSEGTSPDIHYVPAGR